MSSMKSSPERSYWKAVTGTATSFSPRPRKPPVATNANDTSPLFGSTRKLSTRPIRRPSELKTRAPINSEAWRMVGAAAEPFSRKTRPGAVSFGTPEPALVPVRPGALTAFGVATARGVAVPVVVEPVPLELPLPVSEPEAVAVGVVAWPNATGDAMAVNMTTTVSKPSTLNRRISELLSTRSGTVTVLIRGDSGSGTEGRCQLFQMIYED